ncbi:MAG: alpha/beta hydrolase [Christensenellaceae bacterium]|jgi:monoterpene epsilon-lactone hydrolase
MASIRSILMREQIRLLKPLISKLSIESNRAAQDRVGQMGARALVGKVDFETISFETFSAEWITPKEETREDEKVILYLHGGGYTAGGLSYARGFGSVLCSTVNCPVLAAAYRLAPENPFPAAVEDAFSAYQYLLEKGHAAEDIYLAGESAGGGLVFCLVHDLKQKKMPLPGKIVAISPWADLGMTGKTYEENERRDPSLSRERLSHYAEVYARGDVKNPLISPIYGDFTGFPPAYIFAGSYEMLLDDAKEIAQGYQKADAPCTLHIEEGLWHVYVLFGIPEARQALSEIEAFLK